MASLSQKIKFIERRITQKDLAKLTGANERYIRKIKSGERTGTIYKDTISTIYDNLKLRKSPPVRKYSAGETQKLEKDLKLYKKELEIKPSKNISFSLSLKEKINKRREKYESITLNFKNLHFINNTDYVLQKSINQLKKHKFSIGFANLGLQKENVEDIAGILAFTDIPSFIKHFKDTIENIVLKGKYFSGDNTRRRNIALRRKKKVYMDKATDNKLMIKSISLRIYK